MLRAEKVQKSYNELQVLRGIDLSVQQGEVLSVVGESGAGKSTLLHILGTLDAADAGQIVIAGKSVGSMKSKDLAGFRNQQIGFIFQFHNLLPEFTALENVCLPGLMSNSNDKAVFERGKQLLKKLGLTSRQDHKPSELSGGEQQRVAVARSLINNPSIVFADEPSGNLDSKTADELHRLFFDLRNELNQTFVIVTHNQSLAAMADRKIEIKDGVILT
ncbi:MAG: lipoprotein-releasing system ATP-binding protein LolD [Cytophagales bacterium CG12_big_fil_rev_8_21_14_0_65_40_12]|nr:MAG: lipoprotein-releasing system ATP-binding protein LolD [Cytophagales bacterium CG12_big_fil_rev_8_21_14_0_65_40_12]PIW05658.1 MAG: lipoprotein-releasing system ATP-binding protein LolD [Cytophagales bacterium CG17_big_fil_post_rev_8_21_14_2_50_40_13]